MRHILFAACLVLLSRTSQAQKKIIYTSDEKNISSNSAFLSDGELNNNPKAIIIVEADANARAANPHPVGVWYTGSQWAIFNQDMAAMPAGVTFIITWNNPGVNAFYQKLAKENLSNGKMIIDNPSLNNNPSASFFVSQVWNPEGFGGIYNNSDINVEYDKQFGKWMVRNMNGMGLPDGSAYNIIITGTGNAKNNPNYNYPITNPEKNNPEEIDKNAKNKDIADKTSNPIVNEKDLKNIDIINKNTKPTTNPVTTSPVTNIPVDVLANADILAKAAFGTNFGFENQLFNWTATGTAFNNQPVEGNTVMSERVLTQMRYDNNGIGGDYWKGMAYPIGFRDRYWIGTYENGNGDAPTGTLTSLPFKTEKKYLAYLMGGGKDINRLYVELQVKQSDYEAVWGAGQRSFYGETADGFARVDRQTPLINSEELFRYWFDLDAELNRQYVNKTIRICIVDNSSNGWGHINADDFVQTDYVNSFLELNRGGFTLYADPDVPVWGFFDSHAHPAADEAFGKKYYVGSSNTPLSTTWSNDICTANHTAGRTLDGFTNIFDPHKFFDGGWPDMIGYPRFNGKMHQKYQADLIKRAWQGGLRIFCAVGVNNMYIATRALGHGDNGEPLDDESVLYRQVAVAKEMARQNSDWMEIAYTPRDARRIIKEGKLAVILGVENDVFGNFKSADCSWGDRQRDRPLVTITEENADALLENKLNEYRSIGLRQILPIHYLSKPFGGSAVFNGNTFLPQITFYENVRVRSGVIDRLCFNLYEDFPTGPAFVGNFMSYAAYAARIIKQEEGAETSMANADGLSNIGRLLFNKLMDKKFIIDQEHSSYLSKRDIFQASAARQNYPVMASHCDPEGISFTWRRGPVRFNGSNNNKIANFGTTNIHNTAHEMELNDESYTGIRESGGTIGVFLSMNHKQKYTGTWGDIPNDCPGSTKTFAQMYLYSLDKMDGKGVGLASDLPMIDAICPRFGVYSAWGLKSEEDDFFKITQRTQNRYAQTNGVRYDVASRSYHYDLFQGSELPGWEEDVFKALAAWDAGANPFVNESSISISGEPGHADRIRSYARGLFANNLSQLRTCCGATPYEEGAMFLLKNNVNVTDFYNYLPAGFWRDHSNDVARVYGQIKNDFSTWKAKNGTNEPLRRYITGNRYWDFNLDGLAHYGLLPDLLQDLKNIGLTTVQLAPLFGSAEDYIRMWEKADR